MNWEDYNIVMPGRVVEYFPATQTATIQVSAERIFYSATDSESTIKRGKLMDVPVHTVSGGGYSVTMPIKAGDTCLMLFSQFGYDHWLWLDKDSAGSFAKNPAPWLRRTFSNKDGLAIVGLNTIPRAIPNYSATDAEFRNTELTQYISLREAGDIDIVGPAAGSLELATTYTVTVPDTTWTGNLVVTGTTHSITGNITLTGVVTIAGSLVMGGGAISGAADPVNPQDVMTKAYGDSNYTDFVGLTGDEVVAGIKTFTSELQARNADIRTFGTAATERRLTAANSAGAVGLACLTSGDAQLGQYNAFGVSHQYSWMSFVRDGEVGLNSKTTVKVRGDRTDGTSGVELQARNGVTNTIQSGVEVGGTTSGVFARLNFNTYPRLQSTANGVTSYGSHKFQPVATDTTATYAVHIYNNSNTSVYSQCVQFSSSGATDQGSIHSRNGLIPKFVAPSDIRLKKDIVEVDLEESMAKIEAVRVVDYTKMSHMWHGDEERNALCPAQVEAENIRGAIAQEYAEVYPEGVSLNSGDDPEESYYVMGIEHDWDLLNSVKYLKRENDSLKEMMQALTERINVLEESNNGIG